MSYAALKSKVSKFNEEQLAMSVFFEDEYEEYYPAHLDPNTQFFVANSKESALFTYKDLLDLLNILDDEQLKNPVKYMTPMDENIYTSNLLFYRGNDNEEEPAALPFNTPYLTWR